MSGYLIAVLNMAGIYYLLALGLNLHYGYTGLINFGHVGFFAIGAYVSGLLSISGLPIVLATCAGISAAAALAYPIGLTSLRLKEEYLAIVTLGLAEIIRIIIISEGWLTNGVRGIPGVPRPFASLGIGAGAEPAFLALVLVCCVAATLFVLIVVKSPFGRLIQAIRDDEHAVRALGKNPAKHKTKVLVIGAALAGLAGALYSQYLTYISPDQFMSILTFYIWMAIIMGGTGSIAGSVVGTAILITFLEGSRIARDFIPFVTDVQMASLRLALLGVLLIAFMRYAPEGIMGRMRR